MLPEEDHSSLAERLSVALLFAKHLRLYSTVDLNGLALFHIIQDIESQVITVLEKTVLMRNILC